MHQKHFVDRWCWEKGSLDKNPCVTFKDFRIFLLMTSIQIFRLKHLKSNGINSENIVFFRELDKKTICYIQRFSNSTNSENIVFFPENYLRHIDSGDISLVNGKTEGIDGMIKTTFPLLHDFLFLFSECLICFALKHCSGMIELCMIRCSSQINVC